MYGGRLLKAYGASMDAQRCAKILKPLKQWFSFRKESKATKMFKSKPCCHHRSFLAMFNNRLWRGVCILNNCYLFGFSWLVSFLMELHISLRSVSLI